MRVELVPEAEMAELTKQIYAAAKPYRGAATHLRSMMYVLRECRQRQRARASVFKSAALACA
jgi:hypothetical protein